MRILNFVIFTLLVLITGCSGKEKPIDQNSFLEGFQTSLSEQGFAVKAMQPSLSVDMQDKIPFQFSITQGEQVSDTVLIYIFNSSNQASRALEKANYTITTLTKVGTYQNNNVIVIHYALDGDLDKYNTHIDEAIRKANELRKS